MEEQYRIRKVPTIVGYTFIPEKLVEGRHGFFGLKKSLKWCNFKTYHPPFGDHSYSVIQFITEAEAKEFIKRKKQGTQIIEVKND